MRQTVRILGIDPGSQVTGYGLVDLGGGRTVLVECGVIRTSGEHSERLRTIFHTMRAVVAEYAPTEVAVERVFLSRNADSALKLGQARAAALCATFAAEIPVFEYAARHIKKAVAGTGAAEKPQVERMVRMMLGLDRELAADAADALAAALCHAHERSTARLLRDALEAS